MISVTPAFAHLTLSEPVFDGLRCATLSCEQIERTCAGGVVTTNLTIIPPWVDFEAAPADLGRALDRIDETSDIRSPMGPLTRPVGHSD